MRILTATEAWVHLLRTVMQSGKKSFPRSLEILEILNSSVAVDMQHPIVMTIARKLNYKFMAAEAWWILSGQNDVQSIGKYCKAITKFSDDGETFFGAYGPKIEAQLEYVTDKLSIDHDSRQAVINIWRENPGETKDVPCTLSVQWILRDGELHCIDNMRSNDIWLGFPYDVFNFSMLSWYILEKLRERIPQPLRLGALYLNAGSHHIYSSDLKKIRIWMDSEWKSNHIDGALKAGGSLISDVPVCLGRVIGEYSDNAGVKKDDQNFFEAFSRLINNTQKKDTK